MADDRSLDARLARLEQRAGLRPSKRRRLPINPPANAVLSGVRAQIDGHGPHYRDWLTLREPR